MRRISRSSHETHRKCPRKAYYTYMKDTHGYVGSSTNIELVIGLAVHLGMETLMKGGTLEDAVTYATLKCLEDFPSPPGALDEEGEKSWAFYKREQTSLVEALLRGWHRVRSPRFFAEYEVVDVEKERRTLLAPNILLTSRDDGLLRRREDNSLIIVNWKTTSAVTAWEEKWHYDVQAWTEALAAEHEIGEPVTGVLFEGFYKGVRKDNRQCTDLLYGYKLEKRGEETRYSIKYMAPSKASPWERFFVPNEEKFGPSPLAYWIGWIPWDDCAKYFLTSNPVQKEDRITQEWINEVVRLESEVEHILRPEVTEEERLTYFIRNFSHFNCNRCPFEKVCLKGVPFEDLVENGKLIPRRDHHAMEGEVFEE